MSQPTPLASDSRLFQVLPLPRQAPHHRPLILIFSLFQTSEPNTKFYKNTANRFYANCEWILTPPPRHFGSIVFAFLALHRPTDYVYKIWFSLVQGQEFSFLTPLHFGWLVFAFLSLYRPTDYVYKIWFSLVQGQEFSFFDPPPPILGGQFLHFQLSIGKQIMYDR